MNASLDPNAPALFGHSTGATFSPCRRYRYALWRTWSEHLPRLIVIGLNPSVADETQNDPTITRCIKRAEQMGMGGLVMLNIFAWRSTDPKGLTRDTNHPSQPAHTVINDGMLRYYTERGLVLCGWGNHGWIHGRSGIVRELLHDRDLYALKVNGTGQPQHPLYVGYKVQPTLWIPARRASA